MENKTMAIVLVLVAIGGFMYFKGQSTTTGLSPATTEDGIYDSATDTCLPPGRAGVEFYQCCLNQDNTQVSCKTGKPIAAIYQGTPGIFTVYHGITITNTGNVDITKAYIDSATWVSVPSGLSTTVLSSAYAPIVGTTYGKAIAKGTSQSWSTGAINLQSVGSGTFNLALVTKAQATGLAEASQTTPASITITVEAIGYGVTVTYGI